MNFLETRAIQLTQFHLYESQNGRIIAIEDEPDAIDRAQGYGLQERLEPQTVDFQRVFTLIREQGAELVMSRKIDDSRHGPYADGLQLVLSEP